MFGLGSDNGRERVGASAERLAQASRGPASGTVASAPVAPPVRDLGFERNCTQAAAAGVSSDLVRDLIVFAESRAAARGPVEDLAIRDFTRDALEEIADARNYWCWRAQQEQAKERPDPAVLAQITRCQRAAVHAYVEARQLRALEKDA